MARAASCDAARNFQDTVISLQESVRQMGKGDEEDIQEVEKHHITAELRNTRKSGEDSIVRGLQKTLRLWNL